MILGQSKRLWSKHFRLSRRLCQRLSRGVERLCQRLSRLSRRLWRRATHGEEAAGGPGHRDRTAGPGAAAGKAAGAQGRRQAGSASGKPQRGGQRHATRPQTRPTERAGLRRYREPQTLKRLTVALKWQIRNTAEKPPEYTESKRRTPHSVSHAGQGYYF